MEKSTIDFLKSLKKNNNREWFADHKEAYESAVGDFASFVQTMISGIRRIDKSVGALGAGECVFRVFRDVRFSRDKAPYKTNFGAFIAQGGRKSGKAGYYFHLEPGRSFTGGGLYMPDGKSLALVRTALGREHATFRKIVSSVEFKKSYGELRRDDAVKTVPRGFSKEHVALEFLQLKSYVATREIPDQLLVSQKLLGELLLHFKALVRMNTFLNAKLGPG